MQIITRVMVLLCVASLVGCTGIFESKTCGIKNSQWDSMSSTEQLDFQNAFNEKQRLADQMEFNKMSAKQQKNLAKARKNDEKAQARRMENERNAIKKQQSIIKSELEAKTKAYIHPPLTSGDTSPVEVSADPQG